MRGAYRRAAHIIAVSEETRRVLAARAGLESARCTVSHEGADSFLLPEPWADVVTTPRILVVSVLAPYKGLEETIDLFRLLRVLHPELRLEIVGGDWRGFGAVVRRQIASARLNDVVRIRGNVTPAELAKLYAGSLLLLFLSRCESFGLPLVEAMRLGLPTVAADRSSLPEVAGGASLLVDPDRIEDAATQVATLVQDEAARADLAMRGRARAAQLTWRGTAAAIAYAVREVASRSV
jgi:glycosyltransferase involved in cell wall biosynthesis